MSAKKCFMPSKNVRWLKVPRLVQLVDFVGQVGGAKGEWSAEWRLPMH